MHDPGTNPLKTKDLILVHTTPCKGCGGCTPPSPSKPIPAHQKMNL
jgi:Pyruvate/2-oxoacid:ferredoxin oxidoreductase delta subunit